MNRRSDQSLKDTARNIERTGEFVVQLVDEATAWQMHKGLVDATTWRVDLDNYFPVGRFGGAFYVRTRDRFTAAPPGQPAAE